MIVKRELVPFRELIEAQDKGGELFLTLCRKSYPADMWERAYLQLQEYSLSQREMEWAFREIRALIEGFRKLDEKEPYQRKE